MKLPALLLISVSAASVFAQDTTTTGVPQTAPTGPNRIVSLASSFFEHDYFNFYAYGNGVYDSYAPIVKNGQTVNNGGTGFAVGGGADAYHSFRDGSISLIYRGDYRDYQSSFFTSGSDQNLAFGFNKRLSRRWSLTASASAGIFFYGGTLYPTQQGGSPYVITGTNSVIPNPFSNETRWVGMGVSVAYRQTRRLSYIFSGGFNLQRYSNPAAINSTGGSGGVAVQYQLTPRTSLTGSYSHGYYVYSQNVGNSSFDWLGGTVSHLFPSHWHASVSAGVTRTDSSGVIAVPVTLLVQQGSTQQPIPGYVFGPFNRIAHVPTVSGSVSHYYQHSTMSFSAGQGVTGTGNGYYLASRNEYANGVFSYNIERRSNFGVGGGVYRLNSVANTVSSSYTTASLAASYGTMLVRRLGTFARYEFVHYGAVGTTPGVSDNRISFGFNYSSKSIPMTLY